MCMSLWPDYLLSRLAERHTVTILDYPGMGRSTAGADMSWEITDLAQLHLSLIGELGYSRPDLLGWSTGGEIILTMAAVAGEGLGGIISVAGDPGSPNYVGDPHILKEMTAASPLETMQMLFPDTRTTEMGRFVTDLMSRPQDEPSAAVSQAQDAAFQTWLGSGIWDQLDSISNPVLIMHGSEDQLVPAQNAVSMAARIPGAWLVQIPDAGHAVLVQEPELCCGLINLFLGQSPSSRNRLITP